MAYRRKDDMLSVVLSKAQVAELLDLFHNKGWKKTELADYFGIHRNTVSNILKRYKQTAKGTP